MRIEFSKPVKRQAFARANGRCECGCNQPFGKARIEYHHAKEARDGGDGTLENCRAIRDKPCHAALTADFAGSRAKSRGMSDVQQNITPKHSRSIPQPPKPVKAKRDQIPPPPRRQLYVSNGGRP